MIDEPRACGIALGTVQLGTPYGVANRTGQPTAEAGAEILEAAIAADIRWFDTAQSYGDAETLLGSSLGRHADRPLAVVSKLDAEVAADDPDAVHEAVARSARRIGRPLAGMLIHDPSQLDAWSGGLGATLAACRDAGLVERVGVSVYTPEQFAVALDLEGLSIVQAPYSVLDRRLDEAGLLVRARERGIVVMLRSAFLQGLLVMDPARRPGWLRFAEERLRAWDECCTRAGRLPEQVALRFVLDHHPGALVPVGCETSAQLDGILAAAVAPPLTPALTAELEALASDDQALIDPTRWPVTA